MTWFPIKKTEARLLFRLSLASALAVIFRQLLFGAFKRHGHEALRHRWSDGTSVAAEGRKCWVNLPYFGWLWIDSWWIFMDFGCVMDFKDLWWDRMATSLWFHGIQPATSLGRLGKTGLDRVRDTMRNTGALKLDWIPTKNVGWGSTWLYPY